MVDTQRTQNDLLTNLFQDAQSAGAISANDVRDLIVSLSPSYGSMYISTPAATTISVAGTYYKAAGTTTSIALRNFTMPANNRLTYTGTPDIQALVTASITCTTTGTSDNIGWRLADSGTTDANSQQVRLIGTGTDQGVLSLTYNFTLSTNDYIEIFTTNEDANLTVTMEHMHMFILGIIATS